MAKYRKKPVIVDAIRIGSISQVLDWISSFDTDTLVELSEDGVKIEVIGGTVTAEWGDWIIRGVEGEFYPCTHKIFKKTYESAEALQEGEYAQVYRDGWNNALMELIKQVPVGFTWAEFKDKIYNNLKV